LVRWPSHQNQCKQEFHASAWHGDPKIAIPQNEGIIPPGESK
jgi:hypothetical protein